MNLSERINGTIKLDDFLVCKDNIDQKRNEDLADTRLVIAKRIPIKKDSPVYPYKKSGYLYFVDEASNKDTDPHNSVFFFVKVANRKKHNELQDKIYGEYKDHHSLITLLARWRELNNPDGFHVYYATINSKSYWFFNR